MGKTLKSYAEWRLQENLAEYTFYTKKFKRMLISMFKWENLPDNISERFIEECLYNHGMVIFFKSDNGMTKGSYVVTRATPIGYNIYDEPIGYRAHTSNGLINEYVKVNDCVVIWNDFMREPNIGNVNFFAKRLGNIEKTIDLNLEHLKNPYIISCSENQRESVRAVMEKKTNGEPYILVDDDFGGNRQLNVFNLNIQNHISDLEDTKHEIINEALTFFGIKNVPVSKKERLIVSEAEQAEEQIYLNMNVMLKAREQAVKEINEKFGLDIRVNVSRETLEEFKNEIESGVE